MLKLSRDLGFLRTRPRHTIADDGIGPDKPRHDKRSKM
jgi:hypothetical protein